MKISEQRLDELPNLSFVRKLAKTDMEFKERFVAILKEEFAQDYVTYKFHMEMKEPRTAAEIVHKLKYTLGFLSMEKSFQLAERHQEKLERGDVSLQAQFKQVLIGVRQFLGTC